MVEEISARVLKEKRMNAQLEKEIQMLYQQKSNWNKLEKGYQQVMRDLNSNQ